MWIHTIAFNPQDPAAGGPTVLTNRNCLAGRRSDWLKDILMLVAMVFTWRPCHGPSSENAIHCGLDEGANFVDGDDKPPVVLLHPILLSGRIWHDVVPLSVITRCTHNLARTPWWPTRATASGNHDDVIHAAEQYLDDHRLDRPHLVGNSTGGFVAIELARRGRAATVPISPAGSGRPEDGSWHISQPSAQNRHNVSHYPPSCARNVRSRLSYVGSRCAVSTWHGAQIGLAARAVEAIEDTVADRHRRRGFFHR